MRSQYCIAIAASLLVGLVAPSARAQLADGEPTRLFEMRNWWVGLNQPTDIGFVPDGRVIVALRDRELVVRSREGELHFNKLHSLPQLRHLESGLIGLSMIPGAVDHGMGPEYPLVVFAAGIDTRRRERTVVYSGRLLANNEIFLDLARPLLELSPATAGHYGGGLIVRDDELYLSVGDASFNANPPVNRNASCLNHPYGKILRIRLDGSVPTDNPLVGLSEVSGCDGPTAPVQPMRPERRILAWGLRNPWRFWVDPMTKLLWIGDVGQSTLEEISIGGAGHHFGFPFFEASQSYDQPFSPNQCRGLLPSVSCSPPVYEWLNGRALGADPAIEDRAAIGGLIPDEDGKLCGWPVEWKGRYFFGDYGSGKLRTLGVASDRRGVIAGDVSVFGTVRGVTGFRMGLDHALYIVANGSGSIVRVAPRDHARSGCIVPSASTDAAVRDVTDAAVWLETDASSETLALDDAAASLWPNPDVDALAISNLDTGVPDGTTAVSDGGVERGASSATGCGCALTRTRHAGLAPGLVLLLVFGFCRCCSARRLK